MTVSALEKRLDLQTYLTTGDLKSFSSQVPNAGVSNVNYNFNYVIERCHHLSQAHINRDELPAQCGELNFEACKDLQSITLTTQNPLSGISVKVPGKRKEWAVKTNEDSTIITYSKKVPAKPATGPLVSKFMQKREAERQRAEKEEKERFDLSLKLLQESVKHQEHDNKMAEWEARKSKPPVENAFVSIFKSLWLLIIELFHKIGL